MKPNYSRNNSGLSTAATIFTAAIIAIIAGGGAAVGVIYGPKLFESKPVTLTTDSGVETSEIAAEEEAPKIGFSMGEFTGSEAIESIKVTLKIGANGSGLDEKVDLHLGTGFPLRLYPLGDDSREPAFAAFPQKSSLERGSNSLEPGSTATFEFSASGEAGQDVLKTTPELLKDLLVSDIQTIGFATLGSSDWTLEGYRIDVNGELFAENDSLDINPSALISGKRAEQEAMLPENETLLQEIETLETYVEANLATEADKQQLDEKRALVKEASGPINELTGQSSGYLPFFTEPSENFTPVGGAAPPVGEVNVTLVVGGGEQPGTRNPLYVKAGGKKFQLTSEVDPLSGIDAPQEFTISASDLGTSPVSRTDLEQIGIGLIGNSEEFGQVPDRAKIQRLVVKADGETVYDSERKAEDRRSLQAHWLVPPAHLDNEGGIILNAEKGDEKHLWTTGMLAPPDSQIGSKALEEDTGETDGEFDPLPIIDEVIVEDTEDDSESENEEEEENGDVKKPSPISTTGLRTTFTGSPQGTFVPTGIVDPATGLQLGSFLAGSGFGNSTGLTPIRRTTGNTLGGITPAAFNLPNNNSTANNRVLTPAEINKIATAVANQIKPTPAKTSKSKSRGNKKPPPPTITSVSIGAKTVTIGQPVNVTWTVAGSNASQALAANYRVDLMPILPHISATPPAGSKASTPPPPLVTKNSSNSNSRTQSVTVPPPPAGATASYPGVAKRTDIATLYVQPFVTALDKNGQTIGAANFGPIVPLIPPSQSTVTILGPGISASPNVVSTGNPDPNSQLGASFQIRPANNTPRSSWQAMTVGAPGPGVTNTATVLNVLPINTADGLTFAVTEDFTNTDVAYNRAIRSKGAPNDTVAIRFEGVIQYPQNGAPGTAGIRRGYRLVGHLGFLGNTSTGGGTASVNLQVDLNGDGLAGSFPPQSLSGRLPTLFNPNDFPLPNPQNTSQTNYYGGASYFRLETDAPIAVTKSSSKPMTLIDIPIRFDILDQGLGTNYTAPTPASSFTNGPKGNGNANPPNPTHLKLPLDQADFDAYNFAKTNGGIFGVSLTLTADTTLTGPNDSLVLMGLRLVPDIYY